uniref:Uncharacterized protein n=1 Tax=Tanacetum cinerariifolium TaxID=118510 RepID=A0A699J716_TANCI|nr:hypothetical protein [Tanacetum cinerariifolium]
MLVPALSMLLESHTLSNRTTGVPHNQNSLNDSSSISKTSSQSPPNINHYCYEYGDPLDGIFCKRCICKSCGKDAYIGYNCPSKVSVISIPEPCNNQTINKLPQALPIFHPTFHSEAESPFTLDSTPTYVDESPKVFNPPPQPPVLILFSMSSPVNLLFSNHFRRKLMKLIVILRKKFVLPRDCCTKTHLLVHRKNFFDNSHADIESFSPSPIPNKDSDPLMEEIDFSFNPDDPMLPGIEEDDDDSERDISILEELLDNDSFSLLANESYHFDILSPYRPPAKPPYGNTGTLNIKMMGDVSDQKVPIPKLTITRILNQEKSPDLLSHLGFEAFQPSTECPMIINGKNIPLLDVPFFCFYPLDQL